MMMMGKEGEEDSERGVEEVGGKERKRGRRRKKGEIQDGRKLVNRIVYPMWGIHHIYLYSRLRSK